ncbi:uncharacterized protein A1O9_00372 [Exophiala aquamarina CBS 119918]|uniref:Fe-containing alcohol dehydrogenase-like C-terminal domain-containing protein n=1 Tax=Exophiala aquamarina CBS 119918 TaxID=1182545 RepID=A0A072Q3C4_9EURO|nr:uncharacterized protein A1O9_00372 [Exophiala aquamarina CBS 119918]KEF62400.1 hypothetical protein A1O9_00372 [Exophiala aquamarina CBS 119918]
MHLSQRMQGPNPPHFTLDKQMRCLRLRSRDPGIVVLDPGITAYTPSRLLLGTSVRAIDHCVETAYSLQSNETGDRAAVAGLKLLVPALLKYKRDPSDFGAIGHQLGPLGVSHGETSCILLPAACVFNASGAANVQRQQRLARELLSYPELTDLAQDGKESLAELLELLIRAMELPRTLKELEIGRDVFDLDAEYTLSDMCAKTNPVLLGRKKNVLEILEMVAE